MIKKSWLLRESVVLITPLLVFIDVCAYFLECISSERKEFDVIHLMESNNFYYKPQTENYYKIYCKTCISLLRETYFHSHMVNHELSIAMYSSFNDHVN